MDTVTFDGVVYTKASVAARQCNYTPDYIGQLCRAKKLDARLVGRTWFVNLESIQAHKQHRHTKTRTEKSKPKTADIDSKQKPVRKEVTPVVTRTAARQLSQLAVTNGSKKEVRILPVAYEVDEEALLPKLTRKPTRPPKLVKIEPAEAHKISIVGRSANVTLVADSLPEVSLSGSLTVEDYPEPATVLLEKQPKNLGQKSHKTLKNKATSATAKKKVTPTTTPKSKQGSLLVKKIDDNAEQASTTVFVRQKAKKRQNLAREDKKTDTAQAATFTPQSVASQSSDAVPTLFVRLSPLMATLLAVGCVGLLFSASAQVVSSDSVYESKVVLQLANVLEILRQP